MDLSLRPATVEDIPDLLAIHRACCAEITARLGRGHWSEAPTRSLLSWSLQRRDVFVVLADGNVAATVTTGIEPASFWPKRCWAEPEAEAQCVFGLAVCPELQRHGIGTWTMVEMERLAAWCGRRWVRLDAYAANPRSVAFYRKLGFLPRGEVTVNRTRLICFEKPVTP